VVLSQVTLHKRFPSEPNIWRHVIRGESQFSLVISSLNDYEQDLENVNFNGSKHQAHEKKSWFFFKSAYIAIKCKYHGFGDAMQELENWYWQ